MDPLSSYPDELIYHLVTGTTSQINRSNILLFGRQCKALSLTCNMLLNTINRCWKLCLDILWNDWKEMPEFKHMVRTDFSLPRTFICNWLEGKPQIITCNLKDDKSITENPYIVLRQLQKDKSLPFSKMCPPVHSLRFGALSNGATYGNALFINLKTYACLEELSGTKHTRLYFTDSIHPLFFKADILILSRHRGYQIRIYSSSPEISEKKRIPIPYDHIVALQILNDHLVFLYDAYPHKLAAASIPSLLGDQEPHFIHLNPLENYGKFIPFKDKLLLYSGFGYIDNPPCLQVLNISNHAFQITPLSIEGISALKFNFIDCAYCHLDKFFIVGQPKANAMGERFLVIIDLATQLVEQVHPFHIDNLEDDIGMFSNGIGQITVLIPEANNYYTLKFNYDISEPQKGVTYGNSKSY